MEQTEKKKENSAVNKNQTAEEKQVSFDDYVETYRTEIDDSIGFIGQDVDFFIEIKAELLLKLAKKNFGLLDKIKVLDIGSGVGLVDRFLKSEIKNLYGVDVEDGVVAARADAKLVGHCGWSPDESDPGGSVAVTISQGV